MVVEEKGYYRWITGKALLKKESRKKILGKINSKSQDRRTQDVSLSETDTGATSESTNDHLGSNQENAPLHQSDKRLNIEEHSHHSHHYNVTKISTEKNNQDKWNNSTSTHSTLLHQDSFHCSKSSSNFSNNSKPSTVDDDEKYDVDDDEEYDENDFFGVTEMLTLHGNYKKHFQKVQTKKEKEHPTETGRSNAPAYREKDPPALLNSMKWPEGTQNKNAIERIDIKNKKTLSRDTEYRSNKGFVKENKKNYVPRNILERQKQELALLKTMQITTPVVEPKRRKQEKKERITWYHTKISNAIHELFPDMIVNTDHILKDFSGKEKELLFALKSVQANKFDEGFVTKVGRILSMSSDLSPRYRRTI